MLSEKKKTNRLIHEKSPYLLQHATNPVDWYPWCEEAFEKARGEDKPIFLSIGYSACHWCHVMERESFEDMEVAAILNEHFVCIKVDREERPDVDHIYMSVCQLYTGGGGWPTSIFMTAEQKPFFAGTYFPKESKHGMTGFLDIVQNLLQIWQTERSRIDDACNLIVDVLQRGEETRNASEEEEQGLEKKVKEAYMLYSANFDRAYGGSRGAPKFPSPQSIYFLLRYASLHQDSKALAMAEKNLLAMYEGGIYDHVGFGFCRYSTDERWLVPHFEKMLYDNALLLIAYGEAYQSTKNELYQMVCQQVIQFVREEMQSPEGGFYTAIDADSEGKEGKFYLWSKDEIMKILGNEKGEDFCTAYDITDQGNFEGLNIPNRIGKGILKESPELRELKEKRQMRMKPRKDDKIIASQNGMIIAALAICSKVFQNKEYLEMAENGVRFAERNFFSKSGRLLSGGGNTETDILGFADDYVYLIWGLLECYEATGNARYLKLAEKLNAALIQLFWDEANGGLFFYGSDGEKLITRPKDFYDGAVPSSNSICAHNFLRLGRLTEFEPLEAMAQTLLRSDSNRSPLAALHLLSAAMRLENPVDIHIAGCTQLPGFSSMMAQIGGMFLPFANIAFDKEEKAYKVCDEKTTAYVCRGFTCLPPTHDLAEVLQ